MERINNGLSFGYFWIRKGDIYVIVIGAVALSLVLGIGSSSAARTEDSLIVNGVEKPILSESEAQKVLYGKYEIPPTFALLLSESNKWEQQGMDTSFIIGFYPITSDMRYFNTPVDVIPFGNTGMDGIHYGFLTDFGSVTDLEEAPIVSVSPMDFDQPVQLIARNFREFLQINRNDSGLFYNTFASEAAYLAKKKEWELEHQEFEKQYPPDVEKEKAQEAALDAFNGKLSLPVIPSSFRYIQEIREERKQRVAISTQDQLGIMKHTVPAANDVSRKTSKEIFLVDHDQGVEVPSLQAFWKNANHEQKLAIFRDLTMNVILSDDPDLLQAVIAELRRIGLNDEANRLEHARW